MRLKQGQTTMEYTILIIIVLGAFLATGMYIKRGVQGRWKQAVDDFGEQYDPTTAVTDIIHTVFTNATTRLEVQENLSRGVFETRRRDLVNSLETTEGQTRVPVY